MSPRRSRFSNRSEFALKREDTGKLFPATDRARTVLDALVREAERAGVSIVHPRRVDSIVPVSSGFSVGGSWGAVEADRVVLATGGKSVPKTGSDGRGYDIARSLGHTVTPLFPALVPLTLPKGHFLTTLSGISTEATFEVLSSSGKSLASAERARALRALRSLGTGGARHQPPLHRRVDGRRRGEPRDQLAPRHGAGGVRAGARLARSGERLGSSRAKDPGPSRGRALRRGGRRSENARPRAPPGRPQGARGRAHAACASPSRETAGSITRK